MKTLIVVASTLVFALGGTASAQYGSQQYGYGSQQQYRYAGQQYGYGAQEYGTPQYPQQLPYIVVVPSQPQSNPWSRPQFYGGYNTGPYVGNYGFYRRVPPSRFPAPSYSRYYDPYYGNQGGAANFRRFGGADFYGM